MVERGRIKTLFIAGCAMLLITGCAGNTDAQKVSVQEHVSAPDTTALSSVMTIDGETVTKEEYQMLLNGYTAQIKAQFSTDQANAPDFWEMQTEQGTPLDMAMALAKEELLQKKTVAAMLKEYQPDTATDYDSIISQMGQGSDDSYGPRAFDRKDYYDYVYAGFASELLEYLKADVTVTEDELQAYYDGHMADYTYEHAVDVLVAETQGAASQDDMEHIAQTLRDWDMEQETPEELIETLQKSYEDITFYCLSMNDLDTQEGRSGAYAMRWIVAAQIQTGEVCEPFQVGDNLLCMRCLAQNGSGVQGFEEVQGQIGDLLRTERATEQIRTRAASAQIVCDEQGLVGIAEEMLNGAVAR